MPPRRKSSLAESMRSMGALSSVGFAFVLAVVMGFLIGYGLDRWLGLSPLFTIAFFFLGLAAGIMNVVRTASAVVAEEERDESSEDRAGQPPPPGPAGSQP